VVKNIKIEGVSRINRICLLWNLCIAIPDRASWI